MAELYDSIGSGYATRRRPDPRIAQRLRACLGSSCRSVVNVGAGAGSYEPDDVPVVAVEPSRAMIEQRRSRQRLVQARAEALPFRDATFDAAMAVLTTHHWTGLATGLDECARTARHRVVCLTWDPDAPGFWLVDDYVPELLAHDRRVFPPLSAYARAWGRIDVVPVPIPADCIDGFLGAYWQRPTAYLDATVRSAMSSFARVPDVAARMDRLANDLRSGAWQRRHGHLLAHAELDLGYRLVVADLAAR
ncbi:MAG: class I SAM-dependent methyltransferase [Planctomycetes bacterium]|nr:class I SAM-dependent methyltransferase [Planctomycetota bacterium]